MIADWQPIPTFDNEHSAPPSISATTSSYCSSDGLVSDCWTVVDYDDYHAAPLLATSPETFASAAKMDVDSGNGGDMLMMLPTGGGDDSPDISTFMPDAQRAAPTTHRPESSSSSLSHVAVIQRGEHFYLDNTVDPLSFTPAPLAPSAAVDIPLTGGNTTIAVPRSAAATYHYQPGFHFFNDGDVYGLVPRTYAGHPNTSYPLSAGDMPLDGSHPSRFFSHSLDGVISPQQVQTQTHIHPSDLQPSLSARTMTHGRARVPSSSPRHQQQRAYRQHTDSTSTPVISGSPHTSRGPPDSSALASAMDAQDDAAADDDYETQRQRNIAMNQRLLSSLGLDRMPDDLAAMSSSRSASRHVSRSPSKQQLGKRRSTPHLKTQYTRGGSRVPSVAVAARRSSGRLASRQGRHVSYAAANDSDAYSDDEPSDESMFSGDSSDGGKRWRKRGGGGGGGKKPRRTSSTSGRQQLAGRATLASLLATHPSLPTTYPLFHAMLTPDLGVSSDFIPLIGSISTTATPLEKAASLQVFYGKAKRCVAQLDAFVARCDEKKYDGPDEPWEALDFAMKIAIRDARRKAVERTENYKYTRRDLLNKALGYDAWKPIEQGMIKWTPFSSSTDPAGDLVFVDGQQGEAEMAQEQPNRRRTSSHRSRPHATPQAPPPLTSNASGMQAQAIAIYGDENVGREMASVRQQPFRAQASSPYHPANSSWPMPSSSPMMAMPSEPTPPPLYLPAATPINVTHTLMGPPAAPWSHHHQHYAHHNVTSAYAHQPTQPSSSPSLSMSISPSPSTPYLAAQSQSPYAYTAAYTAAQYQQQQQQLGLQNHLETSQQQHYPMTHRSTSRSQRRHERQQQ